MTTLTAGSQPATRSQIAAWALWDCGATGLNAIAVTFTFSVYLTSSVGGDDADVSAASWLGYAMAIAGVVVAFFAPIAGVWADDPGRRRFMLFVFSGACTALTAAMALIRDDPAYLLPGLVLLALTAACCDLAAVPYNAMLRQLTTPQTVGRVSGLGSAAGFIGTVVLLLVVFLGFVDDDGGSTYGLLGLPGDDGQHVRAAMLLTAAWFALFALPVLLKVPNPPTSPDVPRQRLGLITAWRQLWTEIKVEWRRDPQLIYYLVASAVFRDGLTGVFAFGAVLGVSVYGVSEGDVMMFGAAACVIAAVGSVVGGRVDDRVGSKPVIVVSLAAIIGVGAVMIGLSGQLAFFVCGLLMCFFVGPAQASARTLVVRMTPEGREGMAFGLFMTTGRAASFLSPLMFATFIGLFGADRAGIVGLGVVLIVGLVAMLFVRTTAAKARQPV
jgi:UMF1 family MFS transporter